MECAGNKSTRLGKPELPAESVTVSEPLSSKSSGTTCGKMRKVEKNRIRKDG